MTEERDPNLERVFAEAKEDLPEDAFAGRLMARIGAGERRAVVGRLCVGLALAVGAVLVEPMLQDAIGSLNQSVQAPLLDLDDQRLTYVLSPLNSVQGVVALAVAAAFIGYRTLFARS